MNEHTFEGTLTEAKTYAQKILKKKTKYALCEWVSIGETHVLIDASKGGYAVSIERTCVNDARFP